jgi:hypothetical protein
MAFGVGSTELPSRTYRVVQAEGGACPAGVAISRCKSITLGRKLPAFVSPAVLGVLAENFDLTKDCGRRYSQDGSSLVPVIG